MTASVSLLFGVHAHQPAGNFASVVDDAHEKSYGPYLRTVHRYPAFRFAIHFSGWLLDHLLQHHPADMELLREMVERGQAELFGGGDMEPVLASIPYRDRVGQLQALGDRLERAFGQRPRGAWLTERVWEATVVPALADAGIEFVTVDDYHFVCAGQTLDSLTGHFTTEEDDRRLDLFPISEQLRYRIPFSPADETVRYLESLAVEGSPVAAIYFDDIEKFGIWPETYDWVYGRKWLEHFIEGVLASPILSPEHFATARAAAPTRGIVYLPTTSYLEMGEWSLPSARADDYAALIQTHKEQGTYDRFKPFLRGGIWRNFLSRYPEANWMHKRMLGLSARFASLPEGKRTPELQDLLYRSQANDAYWHGLFGGIYLPHLRRAVWNASVALERELDKTTPRPSIETRDADHDGHAEVFVHNESLQAVVRDDADAALVELSSYALSHNFGDTLTRRREHYYRHLDRSEEAKAQHGGIASAHDRVAFRHEILPEDTVPDARARASFLDTLLPDRSGAEVKPRYARAANDLCTWSATADGISIEKRYAIEDATLVVSYSVTSKAPARLRTDIHLAMPSCDGFLGRIVRGSEVAGGFGQSMLHGSISEIVLDDGVLGGALAINTVPAAVMHTSPVHSVSQSEAGFEKIMQALAVTLEWPISSGTTHFTVRLAVRTGKS